MPTVAHVCSSAGKLMLPAESPYDRQVLREHVESLVKRRRSLTLGLQGRSWTISRADTTERQCMNCTQPLGRLRCRGKDGLNPTCFGCALQTTAREATDGRIDDD